MKGTITWTKCSDELPPEKSGRNFGYSEDVLITDGLKAEVAVYCHKPAIGSPFWHDYFMNAEPTHWAYINYP